jgi:hypothetical protein
MSSQSNQNTDRKYKVVLFLVITLSAISSAGKEWQQVRKITAQVSEYVVAFTNAVVPTANASTSVCALQRNADAQSGDDFRWTGVLSSGQAIEIKGINGDITAGPSNSNQVEVVATKKARRGDLNSVQIKVVEHSNGVTICALYPNEDGVIVDTCEAGDTLKRKSTSVSTKRNDVTVDFAVRVPQGVGLTARTINGDISATSLTGNVISRTINGTITISTTGYAEATTINGGISARLGNPNWTGLVQFTTINGEINVNIPANVNADVEAQTLNGTIASDFPLTTSDSDSKPMKHIRGKIGAGGRELLLKTLNGSINLRTN